MSTKLSVVVSDSDAAPGRLVPFDSVSARDLLSLFDLRYRNYAEHGRIEATPEALFYDRFDALPNCLSFGVRAGRRLVGSIRVCVYIPSRD